MQMALPIAWTLLLLTTIILSHVPYVYAVFDVTRPVLVAENPADADPSGSITCIDDVPKQEMELPGLRDPTTLEPIDPNTFTAQELCAKPVYGGKGRGLHLGGFCARVNPRAKFNEPHYGPGVKDYYKRINGTVLFDNTDRTFIAESLFNPRTIHFCATRCFCSNPPATIMEHKKQLRTTRVGVNSVFWTLGETYLIAPDRSPWMSSQLVGPVHGNPSPLSGTYRDNGQFVPDNVLRDITLNLYSQVFWQMAIARAILLEERTLTAEIDWIYQATAMHHNTDNQRQIGVSLQKENEIHCQPGLPPYALPQPAGWGPDAIPVRNLDICAASLVGGNDFFNAGGYCHRDANGNADVFFEDEFTPHENLRWSNFLASAAVRFHCWRVCYCNLGQEPRPRNLQQAWHFMLQTRLIHLDFKGKQGVGLQIDQENAQTETHVIVPATTGMKRAGTCGAGGNQFCRRQWPFAKPPPKTPVRIPSIDLRTCGQTCTSQRDCSTGAGWQTGCRCLLPKLSIDPVFPRKPSFFSTLGRCLKVPMSILSQQETLFGKRAIVNGTNDTTVLNTLYLPFDFNPTDANDSTVHASNMTALAYAKLHHLPTINYTRYLPEPLDSEDPSGSGTVWFNETALIDYANLTTVPSYLWCVCNCTYSSWGCCGSPDGIVHEPSSYNKAILTNCSISDSKDISPVSESLLSSSSMTPSSPTTSVPVTSTPMSLPDLSKCDQEGKTCYGPADCGSSGNCICRSSGDAGDIPVCSQLSHSSFSTGGNRRRSTLNHGAKDLELESPFYCPCNCTYTSRSCCGIASGIVPLIDGENNFGMITTPIGECCDEVTGGVRQGQSRNRNLSVCID